MWQMFLLYNLPSVKDGGPKGKGSGFRFMRARTQTAAPRPERDPEETHEGSPCPNCGGRTRRYDIGQDARVIRHRMHAGREKSVNDPPPEDGYYEFTQHGIVSKARIVETLA